MFEDVGAFHRKFGLDRSDAGPPKLLSEGDSKFRFDFMMEELLEYKLAVEEGSLQKAADALLDLVYVALGTGHMMGLPWGELWDTVQRANMAKERATGGDDDRSKRKNSLDVVKPAGWKPPDADQRAILNRRIAWWYDEMNAGKPVGDHDGR